MASPRNQKRRKPGPKEKLYKVDLPFDQALDRLLSAKPEKPAKKPSKQPR